MWDLPSGHSRLLTGQEPTFSSDSAALGTAREEGGETAWLWDTATGEGRVLPDAYSNVAISPDGKLVAAIGKDGAIHLWNDDLLRAPAALKAWLQKATDYGVSAGSPGSIPKPELSMITA